MTTCIPALIMAVLPFCLRVRPLLPHKRKYLSQNDIRALQFIPVGAACMASLRNRSERLMGLRPLFMLIWLHIPPRSGWFSGLASPVLHVSPLVRIHTKSAIYSSTSDPFRGTLHRTTVLPSALPPRTRCNTGASGRSSIESGAIKYRDIEANTVTAFQYSFRCRSHRTGNASFHIWERFWYRKNAPRSTWKQPRFGAFFRVFLLVVSCSFCLRISFAQGQLFCPFQGHRGCPLTGTGFSPIA